MYDDLIARLEAATGPDRELDKAILLALGYSWRGMAYWFRDDSHAWEGNTHFTGSIDAAITLVPEGWGWLVRDTGYAKCVHPEQSPLDTEGFASTPALAMVIAALRAKGLDTV